ncbi:DUF7683 domain-containing protein [Saccharomonospora iraqiensis]|uniref:DUF7683 domain-containing protein n=1 Tax=Saccharomonospora iraqiensis TaxID=52698 RepID=UPI0004268F57|nr:hypothetical protein [Saccharomonospora iraqiensis]
MGVWVLDGFDERTEEHRYEVDLPGLTAATVRELLSADQDDPMVGGYHVPVDVVTTLVDEAEVDVEGCEWQIGECATELYEKRDGLYLAPRFQTANPDVRKVKAKSPIDES